MHGSMKVFLLDDAPICVKVNYDPDKTHGQTDYHFKTWEKDIKVDDFVVIPTNTRHGYTVGKVTEVDVEPDLEANYEMKWVVSIINVPAYIAMAEKEKEFISIANRAEREAKKKQLREQMSDTFDPSVKLIEG